MSDEVDWQLVENASPENRRLGEVLRRLEGIYSGDSSLDWKESRRRCVEVLTAQLNSPENNASLVKRLQGAEYEIGGDEHWIVRLEEDSDRVYKLTNGDCFGCRPYFSSFDPDGIGKNFHGSINEDPIFYLRRWMLLNQLGEYQTRFEGFLPPEGRLRMPRICVSQPTIDAPNPTRREIHLLLASFGFVEASLDAFLDPRSRVLLTDAAPRNVRIVDGSIALFDVIASIATQEIYTWVSHRDIF
jgi:hypothetical protein